MSRGGDPHLERLESRAAQLEHAAEQYRRLLAALRGRAWSRRWAAERSLLEDAARDAPEIARSLQEALRRAQAERWPENGAARRLLARVSECGAQLAEALRRKLGLEDAPLERLLSRAVEAVRQMDPGVTGRDASQAVERDGSAAERRALRRFVEAQVEPVIPTDAELEPLALWLRRAEEGQGEALGASGLVAAERADVFELARGLNATLRSRRGDEVGWARLLSLAERIEAARPPELSAFRARLEALRAARGAHPRPRSERLPLYRAEAAQARARASAVLPDAAQPPRTLRELIVSLMRRA